MDTKTKIIVGAVGTAVVGTTAAVLISKAKRKRAAKDTINAAQTEYTEILKNNKSLPAELQMRASYTPAQMKLYAQKLEKAMDGIGTDNDAVKDVFKAMNNDLDILLLIEAFGVRDDDDLAAWLEDDGASDYVNDILATKTKITKRF